LRCSPCNYFLPKQTRVHCNCIPQHCVKTAFAAFPKSPDFKYDFKSENSRLFPEAWRRMFSFRFHRNRVLTSKIAEYYVRNRPPSLSTTTENRPRNNTKSEA
jgi:hypothetical protein